ncbi:MAG: flagellar motor switch protein FliN [Pseudomonadota bacterium]
MAEDDQNNENGEQGADNDDLDIDSLLGGEDDEAAAGGDAGADDAEGAGGDEEDPWAAAMTEQLTEDPVDEPPEGFEDLAGGGGDEGEDPFAGGDTDFGMSDLMGGQGGGDAQPAQMPNLDNEGTGGDANTAVNLDMIMDIPVTIAMEIGRTQINIRNLLQLNQGSVVELDRFAGEPLDVMVNGTLIAHGEVVVVNEKFGIRLTDVISAQERIKKLK